MRPAPYVSAALMLLSMRCYAVQQLQELSPMPQPQAASVPGSSPSSVLAMRPIPLPEADQAMLRSDLQRKNYTAAEEILLDALKKQSDGARSYPLLLLLGDAYFLAEDPLQAAVAWQKAAKLQPLPEQVRFSLAMAYVRLRRPEWAKQVLTALNREQPGKALYPFWLGRIEYDAQRFAEAATWFRVALKADPNFVRAHDNLGLCLYGLNDVKGAIAEFQHAIDLQQGKPDATAWPFLNLGIAQEFQGDLDGALASYHRAIAVDPRFDQAHFHLGTLLAHKDDLGGAAQELEQTVKLNPNYLEAHAALARVYRRQNLPDKSEAEVEICNRLRQKQTGAS